MADSGVRNNVLLMRGGLRKILQFFLSKTQTNFEACAEYLLATVSRERLRLLNKISACTWFQGAGDRPFNSLIHLFFPIVPRLLRPISAARALTRSVLDVQGVAKARRTAKMFELTASLYAQCHPQALSPLHAEQLSRL